jgi:hypothetical protein
MGGICSTLGEYIYRIFVVKPEGKRPLDVGTILLKRILER